MAEKIVLVDTSILIDLFRKTDKQNSELVKIVREGYGYCISSITQYEIYVGAQPNQLDFWNALLGKIEVISFDKAVAKIAVEVNKQLKRDRKQIAIPDLFIAATALLQNIPLATLNKKHFDRVEGLKIL